ncbi:MAG: hypothetical protein WCB51_06700 [Candidatus Dormiibacterota bacterium]
MLRRALAPVAVVVLGSVATWLVSGVAILDVVRFVAYDIGFVALPGTAFLWAVRGRRTGFLVSIALGWPLGQTLEILTFIATAAIGVRGLFALYPVVVIGLSALVIWRRPKVFTVDPEEPPMSSACMWVAAAALSLGLLYLALMFLPQAPLPSTTGPVSYNVDFVFFIGLAGQALHHWPLTSPGLAGVPLHYEWFVFLHMAGISQITGLPVSVVALRLDYVPTLMVIGCQLLALGRYLGRSAWTGVAAIAAVFLLGPLDLTANINGAPFAESFSYHLWASWTFSFGLMFLLPLIQLLSERLAVPTWRTRSDIRAWGLVAVLMIGASGAKATILPVVVGGTALYVAIAVLIRRRVPISALAALGLCIVIFAVTFLVVYGTGVPGTGIAPFQSLANALPVVAAKGIANSVARYLLLPPAYAAAVAGVLLPLAGASYLLRHRYLAELGRYAFCLCVFATGLAIANLVHQIAYSEQYFLDTGFVAACLVAAAGLRVAWIDAGTWLPISKRGIVIVFAASLALLLVTIRVTTLAFKDEHAIVARYIVLAIVCVGLVIGWRTVLKMRGRPSSEVVALALVPLLAASALTAPILVAPTVKRVLAGDPITVTALDPQQVWGLTPGLLTALSWMRDHTPPGSVFAVSNHWINPAETDGRSYYYSAFSEREVFIEAYDPARFGIISGVNTPTARLFAHRQRLNDEVFDDADVQALDILTQQYSVSFLFIDTDHGYTNPSVVQLGHIVFRNQEATIVAVG